MPFNLLEGLGGLFNKDLIRRASSSLGENENNIQKAIGGIVPSVLAGLLNKASSGPNGAGSIFNMAKEALGSGILSNPGGFLGNSMAGISNIAGSIFGNRVDNVSQAISSYSGIKTSSASSLLNIAAPAALGMIGKQAAENNLGSGGIVSMLLSQKDKILGAVPSGLGLASALGVGSLGDIGTKVKDVVANVGTTTKKSAGWVLPLLLGVAAVALIWYLMKGRGDEERKNEGNPVTMATPPAVETPATKAPEVAYKVMLPGGMELNAQKGGIEDQLVTFLNDPASKPGKEVWFDFDNLNFETGSAAITPGSQAQINNLSAILKAYPRVKIKVGGYTDKTGDAAANKQLSKERADAVVAALMASGTDKKQLKGAEGYGSEFAKVAETASEEERKKDRRIAVSVREK